MDRERWRDKDKRLQLCKSAHTGGREGGRAAVRGVGRRGEARRGRAGGAGARAGGRAPHSYDTLRNAVLGRQCCERVCERVQRGVWTES